MTTGQRMELGSSASSHVPNLAAQRAYAASVAPPPRPPLPPERATRARLAGGLGGTIMLVGVDLAGLGILLLLLPLVVESFVRWLSSLPAEVDATVAGATIEQLYAGPWPWIAAALLVVGPSAIALGGLVSVRTLRAAGFAQPVRLTLAAFGIAIAGRVVLSVFTAPFSSLLSPLLERGAAGLSDGGGALVGTIVAIVVACAMNVAIAAAIGMVAWWFLAHARRPADPEVEPEGHGWSSAVRQHRLPH
ncbi:hypothetical protein GCM10009846_26790 [Agrococcus versicolor]|uniref:DUF2975 domain-containing protein n=1 Tax=Agrococcus versicolor TaxID=501482 RepID=A0ABN3AWB6_9MICO